jgi:hydroxymethylglutaryl-CoA reductase (NADPH)
LRYQIDIRDHFVFLTLYWDTDEAMGMNMVTIAGEAIGRYVATHAPATEFITVAGNVDSDKKPSKRVHQDGRGFEVRGSAMIHDGVLEEVLKTSADRMLQVATAKLTAGSSLAGAIGSNLHAANVIAAMYLATGQDAAHVVEGSLTDTIVTAIGGGIHIDVRLPALMVGVRGGGTGLPAQAQCLSLLTGGMTGIKACARVAQLIGAAVVAGELSLLAAQASHELGKAHRRLAREGGAT